MNGQLNLERQIKDIDYVKKPYTLSPDDPIEAALKLFKAKNCGAAIIQQESRLVGIFTERDYIRKIAGEPIDISKVQIREKMTLNPDCYLLTDSIAQAMVKMQFRGYRHLILVDSHETKEVVGIISIRDLLGFFCEAMRGVS